MPRQSPLSSAVKRSAPKGAFCLCMACKEFGTEQTSNAKAMEQDCRSPDCLTERSIAISTALAVDKQGGQQRNAFGVEGLLEAYELPEATKCNPWQ